MKGRHVWFAVLVLLAAPCTQARELKLPKFSHLQSKATESVDVSLGPITLTLARWFIPEDGDPEAAALATALKGLKSVRFRHYEFGADGVYSRADIDDVRRQLTGDGWSPLAQIRNNKDDENMDVFLSMEDEKITGFVMVADQPREFTIVNIQGSMSAEDVEKLQRQFKNRARSEAKKAATVCAPDEQPQVLQSSL